MEVQGEIIVAEDSVHEGRYNDTHQGSYRMSHKIFNDMKERKNKWKTEVIASIFW
jgi:hypothetical protein